MYEFIDIEIIEESKKEKNTILSSVLIFEGNENDHYLIDAMTCDTRVNYYSVEIDGKFH